MGQKALVVFGSGHVWRRFGGVTKLLEQRMPGRVLVVETIARSIREHHPKV